MAEIKLEKQKKQEEFLNEYGGSIMNGIHIGLDVLGLIPVVGNVPDLINAGIYDIEWVGTGNVEHGKNGLISLAAATPIIGYAAIATKHGMKATSKVFKKTKILEIEYFVEIGKSIDLIKLEGKKIIMEEQRRKC